jgi:hypothetical protein
LLELADRGVRGKQATDGDIESAAGLVRAQVEMAVADLELIPHLHAR